jgi:hypothetical protein
VIGEDWDDPYSAIHAPFPVSQIQTLIHPPAILAADRCNRSPTRHSKSQLGGGNREYP